MYNYILIHKDNFLSVFKTRNDVLYILNRRLESKDDFKVVCLENIQFSISFDTAFCELTFEERQLVRYGVVEREK